MNKDNKIETHKEQRILPENPYSEPTLNVWKDLYSIRYVSPWLPCFIVALVLLFLLFLFSLLYATVGIISQVHQIFINKAEECKNDISHATSTVQKSAWTISLGVYQIIALPLWIVQLPFLFIGWAGHKSKCLLFFCLILIIFLLWYFFIDKSSIESLEKFYCGLLSRMIEK